MANFTFELRQFADATKRSMRRTIQGVALELAVRIVMKSPVDTGRFRGNWRISVGSPDTRTDAPFDKQPLGSPPSAALFSDWQDELEAVTFRSNVWITNSLPYARRLEYEGWSKQAPAGMVRVSVSEYNDVINKVLAAVKGNP